MPLATILLAIVFGLLTLGGLVGLRDPEDRSRAGCLVGLAVVLIGLGALLGWIWSRFRGGAPTPEA
jgi:hypothetical protein